MFTIEVVAIAEGDDYGVSKDTLVAPFSVPPNYLTSFATADFTPGLYAETNGEVLSRLQEGIAAKALSNRVNMAASLRAIDAFSRITAMSIVGYGDAELTRAYHSILPIALPGRCDWYIRTQEQAATRNLTVTATLIEKFVDGSGAWQFTLDKDAAAGFYEVRDIRPVVFGPATGGYEVLLDTRGLDVTGDGFRPDIINEIEAAYTAYGTATLQFLDLRDHSAFTLADKQDYDVGVVFMPQIADIQETVNSRDVRPYGGDALVRAPVPCFTRITFTIYKKAGQQDPDISAIQSAVATRVNTLGFVGALYASQVQDTVHAYLSDGQTVSAIDMHGRIRYPDSTIYYLRDAEVLQVPSDPGSMVTERTVQFFSTADNVSVTIVTKLPTNL